MTITPETTVADIATDAPATIQVFQQHRIDFCCGGRIPLRQACGARGIDLDAMLAQLRMATAPGAAEPNWNEASLAAIIEHIQRRYHEPLRTELVRLDAMLDKVVTRHGDSLNEVLPALHRAFEALRDELLAHMASEDQILFPFIVSLEAGDLLPASDAAAWLESPIAMMEADHEAAGAALAFIREATDGYAPPEWACPTFRGLYYGLAQFETAMHLHVHLENNVLFPRAVRLAQAAGRAQVPAVDELNG